MATTTTTTTQPTAYRHGDLIIHATDKAPVKGLKVIPGNALATGTATGHSHRFTPAANAKLYAGENGVMRLRVIKAVRLTHEEHADLKLAPGDYFVAHKRQYDRENGWVAVQD
jgi:hypothetical protein